MRPPAAPERWQGHAFGLALESSFAVVGWPAGEIPPGLPAVTLEADAQGRVDQLLAEGGTTIARRRAAAGGWEPDVVRHSTGSYLFDEGPYGRYGVSEQGRYVSCAPPRLEDWRWQRHLVGRVLPFVGTLRGLEPWHASAVAIDGRAIALAGQSGVGKSTLAAELMLGGAELLADDVLAIRHSEGEIRAYPGPGLMSLRRPTVERLGRAQLRGLGPEVGADSGSVRLAVSRHERALSLSALYLLEPAPDVRRPRLETLDAPDPQSLLRCAFNLALMTPARLVRQLDVCAMVARSVRVVRVAMPGCAEPRGLARQIAADWAANHPGLE